MATFRDLKTFVERADGWAPEANLSRSRARTGDHWRYTRTTPDGRVLRTKVAHSLGDEIGPGLFSHILKDQLQVTEEQFWAVIRGQSLELELGPPVAEPLPGWLVQRLVFTVGMPEHEVRTLSADEALAAWERYQVAERPSGRPCLIAVVPTRAAPLPFRGEDRASRSTREGGCTRRFSG